LPIGRNTNTHCSLGYWPDLLLLSGSPRLAAMCCPAVIAVKQIISRPVFTLDFLPETGGIC